MNTPQLEKDGHTITYTKDIPHPDYLKMYKPKAHKLLEYLRHRTGDINIPDKTPVLLPPIPPNVPMPTIGINDEVNANKSEIDLLNSKISDLYTKLNSAYEAINNLSTDYIKLQTSEKKMEALIQELFNFESGQLNDMQKLDLKLSNLTLQHEDNVIDINKKIDDNTDSINKEIQDRKLCCKQLQSNISNNTDSINKEIQDRKLCCKQLQTDIFNNNNTLQCTKSTNVTDLQQFLQKLKDNS